MTDIREEVGFFGHPGTRLFGCLHRPLARQPLGGILICSSIMAEFERNYRRELVLARALASRGLAVQRFHYRGTGNSEDWGGESTLESMVEDALTAAKHLAEVTDTQITGFFGTRLGAFVAGASARAGNAPLALCEPVVSPFSYFREAMRSRLMRDLKQQAMQSGSDVHKDSGTGPARGSVGALEESLRQGGQVDIVGYPLRGALYCSLARRTVPEVIGQDSRPVLVLQIGQSDRLRGEYADLIERLRSIGCSVDARVVADKEEAWWFANARGGATESRSGTHALVSITANWFAEKLEGGVP